MDICLVCVKKGFRTADGVLSCLLSPKRQLSLSWMIRVFGPGMIGLLTPSTLQLYTLKSLISSNDRKILKNYAVVYIVIRTHR